MKTSHRFGRGIQTVYFLDNSTWTKGFTQTLLGRYPGKTLNVDHVKRNMFVGGAQYWARIRIWGGGTKPNCCRVPTCCREYSMALSALPFRRVLDKEAPKPSIWVQRGGGAPISSASLEPTRTPIPVERSDGKKSRMLDRWTRCALVWVRGGAGEGEGVGRLCCSVRLRALIPSSPTHILSRPAAWLARTAPDEEKRSEK